jgi:hypothetical protein
MKDKKWPASRDAEAIAVLRGLILDAAATAGSGHSGTALALAPLIPVLFTRFLAHDPSKPDLETRDRFVLSAGHAGLVIHALLHLRGIGVELDDLRSYRRGSKVPVHPESWITEGIEVTTGPLGQGVLIGLEPGGTRELGSGMVRAPCRRRRAVRARGLHAPDQRWRPGAGLAQPRGRRAARGCTSSGRGIPAARRRQPALTIIALSRWLGYRLSGG